MAIGLGGRSCPSRAAKRIRGGGASANTLAIIVAVIVIALVFVPVILDKYGSTTVTKTVTKQAETTSQKSSTPTKPRGKQETSVSERTIVNTVATREPSPVSTRIKTHTGNNTNAQSTRTETIAPPRPAATSSTRTATSTGQSQGSETTTTHSYSTEGIHSSIVSAEGGQISLGAVEIHIPKGSIRGRANITAGLLHKDISEDAGTTLVYLVELRGGSLEGEIELRLHYDDNLLPRGVDEKSALVGYLDEHGKYHSIKAVIDTERDVVIIKTSHFSLWIVNWPSRGAESWRPEAEKKVLEVPYYPQGDTGYCWATSLAMILRYYLPSDNALKPWEIAGYYKISTDEGISSLEFWTGIRTSVLIHSLLGTEPERHMWFPAIRVKGLTKYIVSSINNGDPVAIFLKDHVVVIVGYYWPEGQEISYYIHDPADQYNGIYRLVPQSKLFANIRGTEAVFTLSVPLGGSKQEVLPVTVVVPSGVRGQDRLGALALFPPKGKLGPDNIYRVIWNGTYEKGYYLAVEKRVGKSFVLVEAAAPDTYKLYVRYGLANAAKKPVSVKVGVYIDPYPSRSYAGIRLSLKEYTLGPGQYMEDSAKSDQLFELNGWPLPEGAKNATIIIEVTDPKSGQVYDRVMMDIPLRPWSYLAVKSNVKNFLLDSLGISSEEADITVGTTPYTDRVLSVELDATRTVLQDHWVCNPKFEGTEYEKYMYIELYSRLYIIVANTPRPIYNLSSYVDLVLNELRNVDSSELGDTYFCDIDSSMTTKNVVLKNTSMAGGEYYVIEATQIVTYTSKEKNVTEPTRTYSARIMIALWTKDDAIIVAISATPQLSNYEEPLLPDAQQALALILGLLRDRDIISEQLSGGAR